LLDPASFVAEFKALADRDTSDHPDAEHRLEFWGACTESGIGKWSPLGRRSELFLAEFTDVAMRAGIALGSPTGVSPDNYFLDCLYNELLGKRSSFVIASHGEEFGFGRIRQACEASAIFWLWRQATINARRHNGTNQFGDEALGAGPDIDVSWGPYAGGGGTLLLRNKGAEVANNVRVRCSTESGWEPILSPQVVRSIPAGGHFRAVDISRTVEEEDWVFTNHGQSIAEFVNSLPSKLLTMTVVFENQLGEERTRGFLVSATGGMDYDRVKVLMEEATPSIAMRKPEASESVPTENSHAPIQVRRPGKKSKGDLHLIKREIQRLREAKFTQQEICRQLGKSPRPPNASWRDLEWPEAYRSPKHRGAVKSWISRVT